jgi:hypothetical protein
MSQRHRVPRIVVPALLAAAAVGVLCCAVLLSGTYSAPGGDAVELVGVSDGAHLAKMQREVQQQLVEAAERRAKASEHRAQAVKLQAKAEDDSEHAVLLHEQAELAHSDAALRAAKSSLAKGRLTVKKLSEKATELDATAAKDTATADKDKEEILVLEDQAGQATEKAEAEDSKIRLVKAASARVAKKLPSLMHTAERDESQASKLKAAASAHMKESAVKSAKAKKLDELARDKEGQAHAMRERLMAVLSQKAKSLEQQQVSAAQEEVDAKDGAAKAAKQAEELAESAEKQAKMAEAAEALSSQELPSERDAQSLLGDQHDALHAAARGKENMSPAHREAIDERRRSNLEDAGRHAASLRAMRSRVSSSSGGSGLVGEDNDEQAPAGVEDEDGHLQLAAGNRGNLEEDGHYSHREEAFKAALANAYRSGYTQELSEGDGSSPDAGNQDGEEFNRGRAGLSAKKPARLEMLGDMPKAMEMLSKGDGEEVHLDKEEGAGSGKGPMFSMLWDDGSSLGDETRRLESHTRRLRRRYGSSGSSGSRVPAVSNLYEDGHTSREEQQFAKQMGSYRSALKQERLAALAKAQRDTQKLSQLPGDDTRRYEERRRRDMRGDQHRVQQVMLGDSHDHWDIPSRHGGELSVHQDEEGHLVLSRRDDGGDGGERYGDDELSSTRGGRLSRIEEELRASNRRDRELEDRTERLQGEVDALRGRGGRTTDLSEEPRGDDERFRRERRERGEGEGPRRGGEERESRGRGRGRGRVPEHRDARSGRNFSPDSTYEKEYAKDPGHVSVAEIKFQHALKSFDRTKDILREGAIQDDQHVRLPELVPSHLPGQGL